MEKILSGVHTYHNGRTDELLREMRRLVEKGQEPPALLITCSDSRILPDVITSSAPGTVFIVRNVGNIVPAAVAGTSGEEPLTSDTSVGAAIEYAIEALKVKHIVVMGHSSCGAMKALESDEPTGFPHVDAWLQNARPALHRNLVDQHLHAPTSESSYDVLSKQNVLTQLDHLASYPVVQSRLGDKEALQLHGWWYKLDEAQVYAYDPASRGFEPVKTEA